jgi:Holliday junction DNA helicase, RuvA subunit
VIARLTGKLIEKQPGAIILETGGVGFEVLISNRTFEKLPEVGDEVMLNIHTHVREEEIRLIGFLNLSEKELFLKLFNVSGISVKIALSSLSIYSVEELERIIVTKEVDLIKRIPGVGKKLAERMILELKDGLEESELEAAYAGVFGENEKIYEVKQALKTLGYSAPEINNVLKKININILLEKRTEDILKIALKEM